MKFSNSKLDTNNRDPLWKNAIIFGYAKPLLNPFSILLLTTGCLVLGLVCYFTYLTVIWTGVRYQVAFQPDYIEIVGSGSEPSEILRELRPGDRIIKLDGKPINYFLSGNNTNMLLTYIDQPGLKELSIAGNKIPPPFIYGKTYLLWSIQAKTVTLDFSHRSGGVPQTLPFAQSQPELLNCNCNQGSITGTSANYLVNLDLSNIGLNTEKDILTFILFLTAISICSIGLFFYIIKPSQITTVFCLLNFAVTLELICSSIDRSYLADLEKFVLIIGGASIGILFLHFLLLFPDGKKLSSKATRFLWLTYFLVFSLILIRLIVVFGFDQDPQFTAELAVRKLNYLGVFFPTLLGIFLLVRKFVKSNRQERLRIKLPFMAFGVAISIPFAALVWYLIASIWQPVIYERFGIFFLGTVIIPPAFGYAIIKNNLLGLDIKIRRVVVHLFLTLLIIISYVSLTGILTSLLPVWKQFVKEPLLVATSFSLLTIVLYQFKGLVQKVVDKIFKVDPLNYPQLSQKWTNKIIRTTNVQSILEEITKNLPIDYHYKSAIFLVWNPGVLEILGVNTISDKKIEGKNALLIFSETALVDLSKSNEPSQYINQATSLNITLISTLIIPDGYLNEKLYFVLRENESLRKSIEPLRIVDASFVFPIKVGEEYQALLILGEKHTEYSPTAEELDKLSEVANQIGISLYNAVLLATETNLRRVYEEVLAQEERTREQERLKVSGLLHDEVLQEILALKRTLSNALKKPDVVTQTGNLPNSLAIIENVVHRLRNINAWLMPSSLRDNLIGELAELYHKHQQENPHIDFQFIFKGNTFLLEKQLDFDRKVCLYRLIEEATANAIKHSKAQNIWAIISICSEEYKDNASGTLKIEVGDDGIGIDGGYLQNLPNLLRQKHFGLNSIRRRVELYGGKVTFHSSPMQGLTLVVTMSISYEEGQDRPQFSSLLKMHN